MVSDALENESILRETTITRALRHRAANDGDAPFVRIGEEGAWLTYTEVESRAESLAAAMRAAGVNRGDRVATILPNSEVAIELVFALSLVGAVQVAMNIYAKGEMLRHQLSVSDPHVLVTDGLGLVAAAEYLADTSVRVIVTVDDDTTAYAPTDVDLVSLGSLRARSGPADAHEDAQVSPQDLAAISFTSGTTGPAKGCMLSHGYYTTLGWSYASRNVFAPGDRVVSAMPCYHLGAVSLLMSALTVGFALRLEPRFSASSYMATVVAEGANVVWGTGTMGTALLAQEPKEHDCGPLERALFVPMSTQHQVEFEKRFGCRVFGSYGQTEFLIVAAEDPTVSGRRSAGCPVDDLEMAIVDNFDRQVPVGASGEIVLRPRLPHRMFSGYWRDPAATAEAWRGLWHHTGDFGRIDEFGELRFVDRKKDAVRRRGENVSCHEVEMVLLTSAKISSAAVYGVPAPLGEDDIVACVAVDDGVAVTVEELFTFFAASLPYFAVPRFVRVLPMLPLTATGKVDKTRLRSEGVTAETYDLERLGLTLAAQHRRGR